MVANRHRHAAYHITSTGNELLGMSTSMTLNDLEPSNTSFSDFFPISGCDTFFKSELQRNGWRQTKTTCV